MRLKVKFSQNANTLNTSFSEGKSTFAASFRDVQVLTSPGSESGEGQNGATFFPSVSDDGVISWTNDRNLPNPPAVNIKGKGEDGFSPIVEVSKHGKTTTISITDKNGEHVAEILDGDDAETLAIPTFDLAEMGLPVHNIGEGSVWLDTDTSEIISALSNGIVRFKFATNFGNISAICNQLYSDGLGGAGGAWLAISSFWVEDIYGDLVIVIASGQITLMSSLRLTMTDVDIFVSDQNFVTYPQLDWYVSSKGFQTKDDVEKLIEEALGVIENGTY